MSNNQLQIACVFEKNMVMQRDVPLKVWGKGIEGQLVTVSIADQQVQAVVENGQWELILEPLPIHNSDNPLTMRIASGEEEIILDNILVGDVYLAGGQSNMLMPLRLMDTAAEDLQQAEYPEIRLYDVPCRHYEDADLFVGGNGELGIWEIKDKTSWRECTPENVKNFSAIGYYFAKDIYESQNIPIGIINCNWGGKSAACWIDEKVMAEHSELYQLYEEFAEKVSKVNEAEYAAKWQRYVEQITTYIEENGTKIPLEPFGKYYSYRPCGVFHTMLKPIAPFGLKGVLWYQGESDDFQHHIYEKMLTVMIANWRALFEDPKLPFFIVQLPFVNRSGDQFKWGFIRQAQFNVTQKLDNTYLAVGIDAGGDGDIHPTDKKDISLRLVLLARKYLYNEDIVADSPVVSDVQFEGKKAIIIFDQVNGKLINKGDRVQGFMLCGEDGVYKDAEARIVDWNQVEVWCDEIESPFGVRYGFTNFCTCTLYNDSGLPVTPFNYELN